MIPITQQIRELPHAAGVYFFYDARDRLIYIGKSIHIRSRVKQHFSGKDRKSLNMQRSVKRIHFELTGSELIALLYESDLIKQHQPLYNRAQRRTFFQYGLYLENAGAYKALRIGKLDPEKEEITSFSALHAAKDSLYKITEKYRLCQKINGLYKSTSYCFQYHIKACYGACMGKEQATLYNQRVDAFLNATTLKHYTRLFELDGRTKDEKGLVYIENGVYRGFGFCPRHTPEQQLLRHITTRGDNKDVRRILKRYI